MDLSTTYLGLKLSNPLMPGASPMTDDMDTVRRLVHSGAAAIVMHSIYQEQITHERVNRLWYEDMYTNLSAESHNEYPRPDQFAHTPRQYLEKIASLKTVVQVPVIASINCTSRGQWAEFAGSIESAGASALELNIYSMPTNPDESAADVEARVIDMISAVKSHVRIPIAVKLSPFYSSLPNLARQIESAGAAGLVLFNRFYQPDFAVGTKSPDHKLNLSQMSDPIELRLRLRWLAILSPQTNLSLALTGGVHTGLDAVKGIMAGAHAIQIVSSLLSAGPDYLSTIRDGLVQYMEQLKTPSLEKLRGCMNHAQSADPSAMERGAYLSILHKWQTQHRPADTLHTY